MERSSACVRGTSLLRQINGYDTPLAYTSADAIALTLRLAVVDSEALVVEQRIAKSPQTSTVVSERKIAPLQLSRLHV
jgi:hypothetical protein